MLCARCRHNLERWQENTEILGGTLDWWGCVDEPMPELAPTLGTQWAAVHKPAWHPVWHSGPSLVSTPTPTPSSIAEIAALRARISSLEEQIEDADSLNKRLERDITTLQSKCDEQTEAITMMGETIVGLRGGLDYHADRQRQLTDDLGVSLKRAADAELLNKSLTQQLECEIREAGAAAEATEKACATLQSRIRDLEAGNTVLRSWVSHEIGRTDAAAEAATATAAATEAATEADQQLQIAEQQRVEEAVRLR
jgi:chromosome segregation ATPase